MFSPVQRPGCFTSRLSKKKKRKKIEYSTSLGCRCRMKVRWRFQNFFHDSRWKVIQVFRKNLSLRSFEEVWSTLSRLCGTVVDWKPRPYLGKHFNSYLNETSSLLGQRWSGDFLISFFWWIEIFFLKVFRIHYWLKNRGKLRTNPLTFHTRVTTTI